MDQSEDQPGKEIKWDPNLIGVSDRKDLIHIKVLLRNLKVIPDQCLAGMYHASYSFQGFNCPYQLKSPHYSWWYTVDVGTRTEHMVEPNLASVSRKKAGLQKYN